MEEEMNNVNRTAEILGGGDPKEKPDGCNPADEPTGCLPPSPFQRLEELAVEGCICVAMLSLATTALGMVLLKDK